MSRLKLLICFICVYATMLPTNITAELSKSHYDIIQLAFTNGFLRGMSIDEETIKELLKDNDELNTFVRKKAKDYMAKVLELNNEDLIDKSKKKEPAERGNSMSF